MEKQQLPVGPSPAPPARPHLLEMAGVPALVTAAGTAVAAVVTGAFLLFGNMASGETEICKAAFEYIQDDTPNPSNSRDVSVTVSNILQTCARRVDD